MTSLIKNLSKSKNFFNIFFNKENKLLCSSIHTNITPVLYDNDPGPTFINEKVQNHLKFLTRINMRKVYRKRKMEDKYLDTPQYKFMTTEQVENLMNKMRLNAEEKLQMPPVVQVRKPINEILSTDSALTGYDSAKLVFTDITYGVDDRERLIVTREPDGVLQKSDWDTRHRMNQIYFPRLGRCLSKPRMFEEEFLYNLLERKEYEFILNAACVQFEPDDEEYQKVTSICYQTVSSERDFEKLRSTRHFGPMVFYLVWNKTIDNLLLDVLETKYIEEAYVLIKLFYAIHKTDVNNLSEDDMLKKYILESASNRAVLELALQANESRKSAQVVSS